MSKLSEEEKRNRRNASCRKWYLNNITHERARALEYRRTHKAECAALSKAWFAANPEKVKAFDRKKHLKRNHGLSPEQYFIMFEEQDNKCAICKSATPNTVKGWSVDHCHTTGKIRGVLCHHCNVGLGHAKDNIEILQNMIAYLTKHKSAA